MTTKIKQHAAVRVSSSRGQPKVGRFVRTVDKGEGRGGGLYYEVNLAPKGQPQHLQLVRPKNVAPI
jgi:hypothetical protein